MSKKYPQRGYRCRVKSTGRIIFLEELIGGERWLCTDYDQQCHPCYNLSELEWT